MGLLVLALVARWSWQQIRRRRASAKKKHQISADSLYADQFIFDDADNELQSRLEEKLSRSQQATGNRQNTSGTANKTSAVAQRSVQPARQTKKAIGLASSSSATAPAENTDKAAIYAQIEKADIELLVSAIESLKQTDHAELNDSSDEAKIHTALIDASEIERLSYHLESTNREIASLGEELAEQTRRVYQLEKGTPDVARREVHQKITLLANSIIERNAKIKELGSDYKNHVALAAKTSKTDPQQSQRLMQQCKVIKLQIKLQGLSLEKERVLMSNHTRLHRALQAPATTRTSSMLQLADQTNEIKNQNANLKSLVDNLNAEFSQLRRIVEGLKSDISNKPTAGNIVARGDRSGVKGKRSAANDASIAAARAVTANNLRTPAKDPSTFNH